MLERERESMSRGGTERERETQNPKQAPGANPSSQSLPDMGLKLTDLSEVRYLTD